MDLRGLLPEGRIQRLHDGREPAAVRAGHGVLRARRGRCVGGRRLVAVHRGPGVRVEGNHLRRQRHRGAVARAGRQRPVGDPPGRAEAPEVPADPELSREFHRRNAPPRLLRSLRSRGAGPVRKPLDGKPPEGVRRFRQLRAAQGLRPRRQRARGEHPVRARGHAEPGNDRAVLQRPDGNDPVGPRVVGRAEIPEARKQSADR
mmetsp:Transcript_1909/g.5018  ORF Transcript_1909/g.5018 Transcript_1909/m.5018 type:complete len:203 (-) Transcript_1909:1558-2166(-)